MAAAGCLLPLALLIIGAVIGGAIGGTPDGILGAIISGVVGLAAMLIALRSNAPGPTDPNRKYEVPVQIRCPAQV